MSSQIVAIDIITQRARQAAMDGMPSTACPYPEGSPAAARWQVEHTNAQRSATITVVEEQPVAVPDGFTLMRHALAKRGFNMFEGNDVELIRSAANIIAEDGTVLRHKERRIAHLECLYEAYALKSAHYDIEHPNDGLNAPGATQPTATCSPDSNLIDVDSKEGAL